LSVAGRLGGGVILNIDAAARRAADGNEGQRKRGQSEKDEIFIVFGCGWSVSDSDSRHDPGSRVSKDKIRGGSRIPASRARPDGGQANPKRFRFR